MITYNGEKRTAKEAAQDIVTDKLNQALGFWFEDPSLNTNDNQWNCDKPMTSKEQDEVQRQVFLIVERALKPCGRTLG
jgi:hypothetical protein|tara:strand:- start:572 stop:805 length:234 start_codon:yes stop_codon:yes gene_type:complete